MSNTDLVAQQMEAARTAFARAEELRDKGHIDGKWTSAEAKASWEAAIDDATEKKAAADASVKDAQVEQKATALREWAERQSGGRLPGMGGAGDLDHKAGPSGGIPQVEYKARSGEVKHFTPTGSRAFPAADEVAYTHALRRYLSGGRQALTEDDVTLAERKALSVGTDAAGGFLVVSEVMFTELMQGLKDAVMMRRLGRVLPPLTAAASIAVPTAGDLDDAEWTSELGEPTPDDAEPYGKRALRPHPIRKEVRISKTLIRLSSVDVEAWVREQLDFKFGSAEERAFAIGTGVGQPEGVFNSSLATQVTCALAAEIGYDDLVEAEFSLKAPYRAGASWIMHRGVIKACHLIKDGNDRPILREMPNSGARFDILNYPVNETEYAPGTIAASQKVFALGNWKRAYWIQDTINLQVQRLDELFARSGQIGYLAEKETDGMLVDGNGCVIGVMHA